MFSSRETISFSTGVSPGLEVDPKLRVRFIDGDDLDQRPRWMAALDMQRSAGSRETQDKATRIILVVRVIFDDLSTANRFPHLLDKNIAREDPISGMF